MGLLILKKAVRIGKINLYGDLIESMDIQKTEKQLEKFIYELETEDRLVRVGLKEKLETAKIYKKYQDLFTVETLDNLKQLIKKESNDKRNDIYGRIYFTLAGSFIGLKTADAQDFITTYFSKAKVKVFGDEIAFYEIPPRISKEKIFEKREKYDDAGYGVKSKINPKQLAMLNSEIKIIKELGFSNYLDYFSTAKKINYENFHKIVLAVKSQTDKLWQAEMTKVSQEILGRPFGNIRACHLIYLRSLSAFDNFYAKDKVVWAFEQMSRDLGLSDLLGNIAIDDKDRPKKNPRAVCYWPKPPEEIHLVIKPIGGEQDFEAMLHEGGHALHGAAVDSKLPYSLKTLSHSNALTEAYAFVLEDLVFEPSWLSKYLNVSSHWGEKIKRAAYFVNLMMLRRYLGKFLYEYEMFDKNKINDGPKLYEKYLKQTTGFVHNGINWLSDMDSGFYSADYLRAWIGAAQIKDYIVRKFGEKWFSNKKAGAFLRQLYSRGVQDELEEVVRKLGYKPFDHSQLLATYNKILG